jgi:hypothetical protein
MFVFALVLAQSVIGGQWSVISEEVLLITDNR